MELVIQYTNSLDAERYTIKNLKYIKYEKFQSN